MVQLICREVHITKWWKAKWKSYILCDSNYMVFWTRQNYGDLKKVSGCQGLGSGKGWIGRLQRIFRARKILLYDTIIMDSSFIFILLKQRQQTQNRVTCAKPMSPNRSLIPNLIAMSASLKITSLSWLPLLIKCFILCSSLELLSIF